MQKRGAYNFKNFLMTLLMVSIFLIGSIMVFATHTSTKYVTPLWAKNTTTTVYNVTVNWTIGSTIDEVRITVPENFTVLSAILKTNWANTTSGQVITFGASTESVYMNSSKNMNESFFQVNVTTEADTGTNNAEWIVISNDVVGADYTTSGIYTSSDGTPPTVTVNNATNGEGNLIANFGGAYRLNGTAIYVNATVTETESGFSDIILYYTTDDSFPTTASTALVMNTTDTGTTRIYNTTIPAQNNGTVISFAVYADDTVNNNNSVEGTAFNNSGNGYNFTIDTIAPSVTNFNLSDTSGIGDDDLIDGLTTYYLINVSVTDVSSNVKSPVQIKCDSGSYADMTLPAAGNNWNTSTSMTTLGCGAEGAHTLTIKAYDNVSNKNESETITLTVDNDAPSVFNMNSNTSYNFTKNNATEINITVNVSDYINPTYNITLRNSSIDFNASTNLTLVTGTMNGSSNWRLTQNLTQFGCPDSTSKTGAIACRLTFNTSDLLGRTNSSENITIYIDGTAPNVTDKVTTNQSAEATNVYNSSQLFNISATIVDNIASVTLNSTSLSQHPDNNQVWNVTTSGSSLGCTERNCSFNFIATDKAGNINSTENLSILIDDSPPQVENMTTNLTVNQNRTKSDIDIRINATLWDRLTNVTEAKITAGSTTTSLFNATTNRVKGQWNVSGTPAALGCTANAESNCTITFTARDLVRNKNATETMKLVVDDLKPRVFGLTVNESSVSSTSQEIYIRVAVNDSNLNGFGVNSNVTLHSTTNNLTLKRNSSIDDNTFYWDNVTTASALGCTSDGACTITINATDDVGNKNNSISAIFQVDTSAPTISGVNVAPNPVNALLQDLTVTAQVQDSQSVNGSRAYIDGHTNYYYLSGTFGGTNVNVTGAVDLDTACGGSACTEGVHTVYVQANNSVGTWGTVGNITFTIDNTLVPTVKSFITPTQNSYTNDTTPSYNISVNVSAAQCEFTKYTNGNKDSNVITVTATRTASDTAGEKYCNFTFNTLNDGDLAQAWVKVRNTTWSDSEPLPFYTIDISIPVVNISSPLQNNVTTTLTSAIIFNITDEVGGTFINLTTLNVTDNTDGDIGFSTDNCEGHDYNTVTKMYRIQECSFTSSTLTDNAKHTVLVSGRDKANNVVNLNRTFIVNTTLALNATLVASDTSGVADNSYANGWSFTFNLSTGSGINTTRFKMTDWALSTDSTTTIEVDGNANMTYTDNTSTSRTYQVHNTYNESEVVYALRDDSTKSGKQSQVIVYVKIPSGTTSGTYTTTYSFGAYQINASGAA